MHTCNFKYSSKQAQIIIPLLTFSTFQTQLSRNFPKSSTPACFPKLQSYSGRTNYGLKVKKNQDNTVTAKYSKLKMLYDIYLDITSPTRRYIEIYVKLQTFQIICDYNMRFGSGPIINIVTITKPLTRIYPIISHPR